MSFASQLWDKPQVVLQYSQDRRREIQQFISALQKRIIAQQTYAKSVQQAAKLAQRIRQGQQSISSLAFSSFKFDCVNRGGQSRIFAKSLREEVLNPLKELLGNQNQETKNLEKQYKKLEKELGDLQYQIVKQKNKYDEEYKDKMETFITNELLLQSSRTPKDKRLKILAKTNELTKSLADIESAYQTAILSYNDFLPHYYTSLESLLNTYEAHEKQRLSRQEENIIKMLIFETSMMKNFEYDILTITNQVEKAKKRDDVKEFVEKNRGGRERLVGKSVEMEKDMLGVSIEGMAGREFEKRVGMEMNKEVKGWVEKRFRGEEGKCTVLEEGKLAAGERVFGIVAQAWKGEKLPEEHMLTLNTLFQDTEIRLLTYLFFQQYLLTFSVHITPSGFHQTLPIILSLLSACTLRQDIYISRKLLNLTFSFYTTLDSQKHYFHYSLNSTPLLQNLSFWKASIFQSIQEELYLHYGDSLEEELEMREMSLVLGQLAMYCYQMVLLGVGSKSVRQVIGWFCRLYGIPDDQNRDLAKTVSLAVKRYKEVFREGEAGVESVESVESNPRGEKERREMIEGIEKEEEREKEKEKEREREKENEKLLQRFVKVQQPPLAEQPSNTSPQPQSPKQ